MKILRFVWRLGHFSWLSPPLLCRNFRLQSKPELNGALVGCRKRLHPGILFFCLILRCWCHLVMWCPFVSWLDFSPDEFSWFMQSSAVEQTWWTTLKAPTVPQTDGPIITDQRAIYGSPNQAVMALSMSSCERTRDTESSFRCRGQMAKWSADLRSRASYAKPFNRSFSSFHSCLIVGINWPFRFR